MRLHAFAIGLALVLPGAATAQSPADRAVAAFRENGCVLPDYVEGSMPAFAAQGLDQSDVELVLRDLFDAGALTHDSQSELMRLAEDICAGNAAPPAGGAAMQEILERLDSSDEARRAFVIDTFVENGCSMTYDQYQAVLASLVAPSRFDPETGILLIRLEFLPAIMIEEGVLQEDPSDPARLFYRKGACAA